MNSTHTTAVLLWKHADVWMCGLVQDVLNKSMHAIALVIGVLVLHTIPLAAGVSFVCVRKYLRSQNKRVSCDQ